MILRQRSPSTMSFHADPDSGLDDLDMLILRMVDYNPGISINALAAHMTFYNKDDPSEESRASYHTIWYRVNTLKRERLLRTRSQRTEKGRERRCYPI